MARAPKIQVFDSAQYAQDFTNIADPVLRRKLIRQLNAFLSELQSTGLPDPSRETSEIAGWQGYHFAYLEKPYGLVFMFEERKLYLGRIALDGDILLF
jgi:hypothetical protein